jgi:hypothetical protein
MHGRVSFLMDLPVTPRKKKTALPMLAHENGPFDLFQHPCLASTHCPEMANRRRKLATLPGYNSWPLLSECRIHYNHPAALKGVSVCDWLGSL